MRELAYYWAIYRVKGENKLLLDLFDLELDKFPIPVSKYIPNLKGEYFTIKLGNIHNRIERDRYPPNSEDDDSPPSHKTVAGSLEGHWSTIDPLHSNMNLAQSHAMHAQVKYLKYKDIQKEKEAATTSSKTRAIVFENKGGDMETVISPSNNINGDSFLIDVMKIAQQNCETIFSQDENVTDVFRMEIVVSQNMKIPITLFNARTLNINTMFGFGMEGMCRIEVVSDGSTFIDLDIDK